MERTMHKPNKKHTLDEVLKSLQDLIRNELLDDTPRAHQSAAPEQRPHEVTIPGPDTAQGTAAASASEALGPAVARLDIPQVIASLHTLATEELDVGTESCKREPAPGDPEVHDPAAAPGPHPPAAEAKTSASATSTTAHDRPRSVPPEGLQQELPLFAPPLTQGDEAAALEGLPPPPQDLPPLSPTAALAPQPLELPEAADGAERIELEEPFSSPGVQCASDEATHPAAAAAERAPAEVAAADDIPVLLDVALPAPGEQPAAALPQPSAAHALAVRVVARLNIELRQSGGRPLEPKFIKRLEALLREELQQAMQSAQ